MNPKESIEIRQHMAEMHESVIKRIDSAYKKKHYIEVCWLCYACFESRVNRGLEKIASGCGKDSPNKCRRIGIRTKLECYARLIKSGYPPLAQESLDLINTVKGWCVERNVLIHGLVSLEFYNDADKKFKNLANRGKSLVQKMYAFATDIREYYYQTEHIPKFDSNAICKCRLRYKCIQDS